MTTTSKPRGEIVNPHVREHTPEPKPDFAKMQRTIETAMNIGAIFQLANWSAEEMKRHHRCTLCGGRVDLSDAVRPTA